MRILRWCATGLIIGLLVGCSYSPVLHSVPAGTGQIGLVYALPKAQFQLDAARKVVSSQDLDDTAKANDAAAEALTAADKAVVGAKSAVTIAQSNVDAISATDPSATQEKLANDLAIAIILLRARGAEAEVAKIRAADAVKRLAEVKANLGKMEQSVLLKPLPAVPDHRHRYAVQFDTSIARDDSIKLTMASGMLNSSVSESTGQAGALMVNLISSMAGVKSPTRSMTLLVESPAAGCKAFTFSRTFDPTDMTELIATATALGIESQDALQLVYDVVEVKAEEPKPSPTTLALPAAGTTSGTPRVTLRGLVYRAPRLARVEVKAKESAICAPVTKPSYASLSATVPDAGTLFVLPVEAGSFTKSKVEYAFKDGMLITFSVDRPSQAVAIGRLPLDMMKAIVEVPASILKLRVDYESNANALTEAEMKGLKAQLDLLKAHQALNEARSFE